MLTKLGTHYLYKPKKDQIIDGLVCYCVNLGYENFETICFQ